MELLMFMFGAMLGTLGTLAFFGAAKHRKNQPAERATVDDEVRNDLLQFENFMNYSGSERGQKEL